MTTSFRLEFVPGARKIFITSLILYFLSQILFLINIQFPRTPNFDEFHYVPSAKQFLELKSNRNWEHPPLGKLIMAVGIGAWGDRPIGWRYMSTLFGSLTLVGMYLLALVLFKNQKIAIWTALITVSNQLLYVQSRIGMLDTFMFAFLVWGMVTFAMTWNSKKDNASQRQLLAFTGLMLGLGSACKWFGIVVWASLCFLIFFVRILQKWQTLFNHPQEEDWYRPNLWKELNWSDFYVSLGIIPIITYFLTFIPFFFVPGGAHSIFDLFRMQYQMWDGQLRVISAHPYMSHWTDWAILRRPIWYAFDKEDPDKAFVRGVILLGNPLIMWTGLVAIFICARDWFRHRKWDAFFILYFYCVFYGCWVIIPRKISFYYYYYPAGMMLGLALAYVFKKLESGRNLHLPWARWVYLGVALGVFAYFFPILAALKIPASSFRQWMWFSSWI